MIPKAFDQIDASSIQTLIDNSVREMRSLDYKRDLKLDRDEDKKEFLADISSFANATGGDLIYGIPERLDENCQKTGEPDTAIGLPGFNPDQDNLKIRNIIRDGIAPRINGIRIKVIEDLAPDPVLIIRIPQSWNGPHMIRFKAWSRFYSRTGAGKQHLDVSEIRTAFLLSGTIQKQINRFLDERIGRVVAEVLPAKMPPGPKALLHILPVSAFGTNTQISPTQLQKSEHHFSTRLGGGHSFINLEGALLTQGNTDEAYYVQLYRSGIVEVMLTENDLIGLKSASTEQKVINSTEAALLFFAESNINTPVFISLTLLGVKGLPLLPRTPHENGVPFQQDIIKIPELHLDALEAPAATLVRPILDMLWNAAGFPESENYDAGGNYRNSPCA